MNTLPYRNPDRVGRLQQLLNNRILIVDDQRAVARAGLRGRRRIPLAASSM